MFKPISVLRDFKKKILKNPLRILIIFQNNSRSKKRHAKVTDTVFLISKRRMS